jgi:hypothetical protein
MAQDWLVACFEWHAQLGRLLAWVQACTELAADRPQKGLSCQKNDEKHEQTQWVPAHVRR